MIINSKENEKETISVHWKPVQIQTQQNRMHIA